MAQRRYVYTTPMSIQPERKVVHMSATRKEDGPYQFISFELGVGWSMTFPHAEKGRQDIITITLPAISKEIIKAELARLNRHIEGSTTHIRFWDGGVMRRRGGIPHSSEYGASARSEEAGR